MKELLDTMKTGYYQYTEEGQYLALFFLGLLFLCLVWAKSGRQKSPLPGRGYVRAALVLTGVLLFPASAWLLLRVQTAFYTYSSLLLLLPVTGMLAYAMTEAEGQAVQYLMKNGLRLSIAKKYKGSMDAAMLVVAALLLMVCGSMEPAATAPERMVWQNAATAEAQRHGTPVTANAEKIPADIREILKEIPEQKVVAAPDAVLEYARLYSGNILLLYGRNMWNQALNAYTYDTYEDALTSLHIWLNPDEEQLLKGESVGSSLPAEVALNTAAEHGAQVLILTKAQYEEPSIAEALKREGRYEYGTETPYYVLLMQRGENGGNE